MTGGLFDGTPFEQPVTCEHCSRPLDQCDCPRSASGEVLRPKDQPVRVQREKRKGGKTVTVITGLDPVAFDLPAILKQIKSFCAAGGTVSGGQIEVQGDHRERVVEFLVEQGYRPKVSGG